MEFFSTMSHKLGTLVTSNLCMDIHLKDIYIFQSGIQILVLKAANY